MRFSNKIQRNLHAQVRLIPEPIWSEIFMDCLVPDFLIPWMTKPYQEFENQLTIKRGVDKNKAWVAIACSHPTMNNQQLIEAGLKLGLNSSEMFNLAVMLGDSPKHLDLLRTLSIKEPSDIIRYQPRINRAAQCGHVKALDYCIRIIASKASYKTIIASFQLAAANGQIAVMDYLEKIAPKNLQDMIAADKFDAFRRAAANGQLDALNYLESKSSHNLQQMIAADDFDAFSKAAANGQLAVLNYLESKSPHNLQEMIAAGDYTAFRRAAGHNQLDVLKYLEKKAPDKLQDMITACAYDAFQGALENGHLDILRYLEEKAPDKLQDMIEICDEDVFQRVARDGHLDVLKYLEEKAPNKLQEIIATQYHDLFPLAATNGHHSMVEYLLNHPRVFSYAEAHEHEYGEHIASFVTQKLINLGTQQQQVVENNLDGVFDITSLEEQKLLFYIARNIIRRNDARLIDDLRFLLNIPSIKASAHTAVTSYQPNELLRLALSVGNREAATVLLNLPQVRILSEQNDYYRGEQQGRLDLAALAADRESSMTALTQSEQQQLQAVIERYQPLLDKAGIDNIMIDLRQTLIDHYETSPAIITNPIDDHHQNPIRLPIEWENFETLNLNPEQKGQALKAYYQNKAHTAWRYLSKPNPWMNEQASYVYINEEHNERWSTFEEYQSLISLFYLAAIDRNTPCIDEYTFATRLEHFIDELAQIGRAHNWDKSRTKDNGQSEQYDDLEGDRPSCYSGVKRRLFQSVLGHPLLKLITNDLIKVEIQEFFSNQFIRAINQNNPLAIKEVWDKGIEGDELSDEDTALIQSLNINKEQQQCFKNYLCDKYGPSFATNISLNRLVDQAFELTPPTTSHLFKHGGIMVNFFEKLTVIDNQIKQTDQNPHRFFADRASCPEEHSFSLTPKL